MTWVHKLSRSSEECRTRDYMGPEEWVPRTGHINTLQLAGYALFPFRFLHHRDFPSVIFPPEKKIYDVVLVPRRRCSGARSCPSSYPSPAAKQRDPSRPKGRLLEARRRPTPVCPTSVPPFHGPRSHPRVFCFFLPKPGEHASGKRRCYRAGSVAWTSWVPPGDLGRNGAPVWLVKRWARGAPSNLGVWAGTVVTWAWAGLSERGCYLGRELCCEALGLAGGICRLASNACISGAVTLGGRPKATSLSGSNTLDA